MISHCELCVCLGFELVWIGVRYNHNSVMNYFEISYWCTGVRPDQNLM